MPTILDRYIFKQVLTATVVGVVLFVVVWISPEILFKIIRNTIHGDITFQTAIKLFFLEIPEIMGKAIPVGLMIGSLFVFDRLSKDSELTIIRGIGVSIPRLFLPILILSSFGVLLCYFVIKDLIPYSTTSIKQIKNETYQEHFVFMDKNSQGKPKNIIIVGGYDGTKLNSINYLKFSDIVNSDTPLIKSIITAETATINDKYWVVKKGIEYKIASSGVYENTIHFNEMKVLEGEAATKAKNLIKFSSKKPMEMTNSELQSYINTLKSCDMSDEYRFALSKYYQRYAQAFACIVFAVCGVLLGFRKPREKRFIGFTVSVALIFAYYIILPFLDMLVQSNILTPFIGAWFPNFIIIAAIVAILKYKEL